MAGFSTNYKVNRPQLSACAADLNSTTNCAHTAQKISSQNQVSRNAAMRGGGGEAPPRITISQAPASSSGTISASPVNANTNMVTTTKASVGGQAQTQYDSDVDTSGLAPKSSSPRPKSQTGGGNKVSVGGDKVSVGGAFGKWINHLNKSGGGKKRGRRKRRRRTKKKRGGVNKIKKRKHRTKKKKRGRRARKRGRRTRKHRKKRQKRLSVSVEEKLLDFDTLIQRAPAFRKKYFDKLFSASIKKYKKQKGSKKTKG